VQPRKVADPFSTTGGSGEQKGQVQDVDFDCTNQFENLVPRFKGKRKVDWKELAKGMEGRIPQQCRLQFMNHRALYRIKGDY